MLIGAKYVYTWLNVHVYGKQIVTFWLLYLSEPTILAHYHIVLVLAIGTLELIIFSSIKDIQQQNLDMARIAGMGENVSDYH